MSKSRIVLKGSHRNPIPNSQPVAGRGVRPDPNTHVEVTISLRRKASIPTSVTHSGVLNKEQLTADYGATASDFMAIQQFAEEYNLQIVEESPLTCTVKVAGRIEDLEKAFGTSLKHVKLGDHQYRQRTGHISLPEDVASIIDGVFGLDDRPQAEPRFRSSVAPRAAHSFSPLDIAKLYNFPAGDGTGQTIGIIELGGGFAPADLNTYFHGLGLTTPTVTAVPVSGGTNKPTGKLDSADVEVMLDIEVAGAVAPKSTIKVYFAPNTDKGFLDAINKAIQDMCTVISISWGSPEFLWTKSSMNAFEKAFQTAAGLSIPVTVASGDNGSTDLAGYNSKQKYNAGAFVRFTDNKVYKCLKNNTLNIAPGNTSVWQVVTPTPIATDFPASAPHALGCGGTHLEGSGTTITKEEVWNAPGGDGYNGASGGGVSSSFAKPSYQNSVTVPAAPVAGGGRGVPDVSGDADPATGYKVRADGKDIVVGGTSAVSPLWAGLIARLAQKLGHRVPFLNPILYAHPNALIDITVGNNDVGSGGGKYKASTGWDPCTGLGSPKGAALLTVLGGGTTTTPPPTTTKAPTPPPTTTKKPTPPPTTTKKPTPPPTTTKKPTPPPTTTKKPTPPPTTTKKPTPPPTTTKKPTPPPTTTKKPTPPPTTTKKPTPPPTTKKPTPPPTTKQPTPPPTTTSAPPPTTTGSSGSMIGAPAFNNWYQVPPAYEPAPVTPVTAPQAQAPSAASLVPAVSAGDGGQTAIVALVSTVATVATTAITAITAITGIAAGKK